MHAICFLAVAMVGVDVGWRPAENGDLEYIIQIDPQQARTLKTGDVIEVGVRPQLRSVRQFRIVVGNESLPRQMEGEPTSPPPIAVVEHQESASTPPATTPSATTHNLGESIVVPPEQNSRNEEDGAAGWMATTESGPSTVASKGTTIPTVPIDPERLAVQAKTGPRYRNLPPPPQSDPPPSEAESRGYRYGDSVPIQPPPGATLDALPPPPQSGPLQIPLPPPPQIEPPAEMSLAQEPDATLPSKASALPVTTVPQENLPVVPATSLSEPATELSSEEPSSGEHPPDRTGGVSSTDVEPAPPKADEGEGPPTSTPPTSTSSTSGDPPTPWLPLTFTLFALFASLGGNLYLGWITWELRNRFRQATKETS